MEVVTIDAPMSRMDSAGIFYIMYIPAAKYWMKKKGSVITSYKYS
jgi:hypothetical protein